MERIKEQFEDNKSVRTMEFTEEEEEFVETLFLITSKPVIYACNVL